jgi:hypothetical protein
VNIEHLRRSLKTTWLKYYRDNRSWIVRLGVWVNCEGQRRPSSSFILATLAILEPQLSQLLPLVVDLSSNPDRIVAALGLNFNPDAELESLTQIENGQLENGPIENGTDSRKLLPSQQHPWKIAIAPAPTSRLPAVIDESCEGVRNHSGVRTRE